MDVDTLTVSVAGLGAVGLVAGTRFIVTWLRMLFGLDGQAVLFLATGVAAFQVIMFGLTQTTWKVQGVNVADGAAWVAVGAYVTCLLGSGAAAVYEMDRVASAKRVPEADAEPHWSGR
jgi:hypothetical protein